MDNTKTKEARKSPYLDAVFKLFDANEDSKITIDDAKLLVTRDFSESQSFKMLDKVLYDMAIEDLYAQPSKWSVALANIKDPKESLQGLINWNDEDQLKKLIKSLDKNKNGKISKSELIIWIEKQEPLVLKAHRKGIKKTLRNLKIETRQPYEVTVKGFKYFFSSFDLAENAEDAASSCKKWDLNLLSIKSEKEYLALKAHMDNGADEYWIGLDSFEADTWQDGVENKKWMAISKENPPAPGVESCIQMIKGPMLHAKDCLKQSQYICKMDLNPRGPFPWWAILIIVLVVCCAVSLLAFIWKRRKSQHEAVAGAQIKIQQGEVSHDDQAKDNSLSATPNCHAKDAEGVKVQPLNDSIAPDEQKELLPEVTPFEAPERIDTKEGMGQEEIVPPSKDLDSYEKNTIPPGSAAEENQGLNNDTSEI